MSEMEHKLEQRAPEQSNRNARSPLRWFEENVNFSVKETDAQGPVLIEVPMRIHGTVQIWKRCHHPQSKGTWLEKVGEYPIQFYRKDDNDSQ